MLEKHRSAAGILDSKQEAERAIRDLLHAGHDLNHVSVMAMDEDAEGNVVGSFETGHRSAPPGRSNQLWGGVWGMVSEAACFDIAGLGTVMAGGPLVAWIIGARKGASASSLSVIGGALMRTGVPLAQALRFESALRAHRYVMIVHGTALEVALARRVLRPHVGPNPPRSSTARRPGPWETSPTSRRTAGHKVHAP